MDNSNRLRKVFETLVSIPDSEWDFFSSALKTKNIATDECFINLGDIHHDVGFVVSGLFKISYINSSGQKFIRNFCAEDQMISAYTSLLQERPAEAEIRALENSQVLYFSLKDLENIFDRHICWQALGRKMAEKYFTFREAREFQLLTQKSYERYRYFQEQFGPIAARIKQSDIAAYIGMTPESLSRLLRDKKNE